MKAIVKKNETNVSDETLMRQFAETILHKGKWDGMFHYSDPPCYEGGKFVIELRTDRPMRTRGRLGWSVEGRTAFWYDLTGECRLARISGGQEKWENSPNAHIDLGEDFAFLWRFKDGTILTKGLYLISTRDLQILQSFRTVAQMLRWVEEHYPADAGWVEFHSQALLRKEAQLTHKVTCADSESVYKSLAEAREAARGGNIAYIYPIHPDGNWSEYPIEIWVRGESYDPEWGWMELKERDDVQIITHRNVKVHCGALTGHLPNEVKMFVEFVVGGESVKFRVWSEEDFSRLEDKAAEKHGSVMEMPFARMARVW